MPNRRGGHAKKIDTVHWTSFDGEGALGAGVVGLTVLAVQHLPETLLRLRGEWACNLTGALADASGAQITAGMILVPEGTSTTVLWSPFTDADAPWIWWDVMHLMYEEYVADGNYSSNTSDGRRVIDSKAMRKVRNREVQLVVENTTILGLSASSARAKVSGRALSGS